MQNTVPPLVSVICLSYKHEKYVERCLRSIINQTFYDFEIIFIDNNSPDKSYERGLEILKAHPVKYRAFKTAENYGIAGGFNYGAINFASGKYVSTIACDDFWDMYNLEEKVKYFKEHNEFGMIYGNGYNYFEDTREIALYYKKPSPEGWILKELLKSVPINPQGVLYRTDVLEEVGYWDEKALIEDRELFCRIARLYPIGYLHIPLTFYRTHKNNVSSNLDYMRKGNKYLADKYEKEFPEEIKIAKIKHERFYAHSMSINSPTPKTLFKLLKNYQFNWLYTKEVIRCLTLIMRRKTK